MTERAGRLYGVGLGPGRPGAGHGQGGPADRRGRRDRLPRGPARPQHRPRDRRAVPARRPDRGAADLPGHHRDHRPPRRLPGRDRRVLRRAPPRGSPRTSTPAATWWCWPRATRSSTAPTCTCTSGWRDRYATEVVPGVTSVSAAAAVLGRPLVERDEVLTVLPGTLPPDELAARLAGTDAAAVMKLGRTFAGVREALDQAGRLRRRLVRRARHHRPGARRAAGRRRPRDGAVLLAGAAAEPGRDRVSAALRVGPAGERRPPAAGDASTGAGRRGRRRRARPGRPRTG